jgi:hypothetical protein
MAPVLTEPAKSYNGQRSLIRCLVGNDGCIELFRNHAGRFMGRNQPQIAASDPKPSNALLNRHMDLAGSVDHSSASQPGFVGRGLHFAAIARSLRFADEPPPLRCPQNSGQRIASASQPTTVCSIAAAAGPERQAVTSGRAQLASKSATATNRVLPIRARSQRNVRFARARAASLPADHSELLHRGLPRVVARETDAASRHRLSQARLAAHQSCQDIRGPVLSRVQPAAEIHPRRFRLDSYEMEDTNAEFAS